MYQHPVLLDQGKIIELPECTIDNLYQMLAQFSKEHQTNCIALYGARAFNEKLAHDIYDYSATQYGINDLEIEVN